MSLLSCGLTRVKSKSMVVWIYWIILASDIAGVIAEKCRRKYSDFRSFNGYYDDLDDDQTMTDCMWGCCYYRDSPCCTAPISLIIGCAIGGILLVAVATVFICCCWVCKKRNRAAQRAAVIRFGDPRAVTTQEPVVYHSESSGIVSLPPYPHYEMDAPPSYDEVMRGETNSGFKPDTS
ncbi:unnamed protein product [Lymnaea stagnalis]|uniref:Vesicular, overexpressed in cancer, prosurvival protein 1 n=1 Tax=Lymnaea stagnalis TaxID=6523 RepID=A0AAV2HJZ6_LYMST